jgi:hypothetical protein
LRSSLAHTGKLTRFNAQRSECWRTCCLKIGEGFCSEAGDLLKTNGAVRALLDHLPGDCTLEDVLHHLYVVHAVARGEADDEAGRTIPHEQVEAELRRRWLLRRAR